MTPEMQKAALIAKVRSMIAEVEDRTGSNPYSSFDLDSLSIEDLERIRKDLHEVLYAPPPRGR